MYHEKQEEQSCMKIREGSIVHRKHQELYSVYCVPRRTGEGESIVMSVYVKLCVKVKCFPHASGSFSLQV